MASFWKNKNCTVVCTPVIQYLNFHFCYLKSNHRLKNNIQYDYLLFNLDCRELLDFTENRFIKILKIHFKHQSLYTIIFSDLDLAHVLLMKIYS